MSIIDLNFKSNEEDQTNNDSDVKSNEITDESSSLSLKDNDDSGEGSNEKTIVLDGPLSHIYTKALNLAYSKEDMMMALDLSEYGDDKEEEEKDYYVYCCDGDNLDSRELTNVFNKLRVALDSHRYKKIILSMESKDPNDRTVILDNYSRSNDIKVFYKRSSFIETISRES